jgi:hypothetical protein
MALSYSNNLISPHPKQNTGELPQPLSFAIDTMDISERLERVKISRRATESLAAADYIANQVRKALWYPQNTSEGDDFAELGVSNPPKLSDLETKQAADCIGFTIVTAEFLSRAGITHWVGFANGHANLVMDTGNNRSLFMLDPLSPELDQDIKPALMHDSVQEIRRNIHNFGRAAIMLNSTSLIKGTHSKHLVDPKEAHPWLQPNPSQNLDLISSQPEKPQRIVMGLFPAFIGRRVLQAYSAFQHATLENDVPAAADALEELECNFPDMDARKSHHDLRWVLAGLVKKGEGERAQNIVQSYFQTFNFIPDSRFAEAEGDCYKLIARATGDGSAASAAIEAYQRAIKMPKGHINKDTLTKKIAKLTALAKSSEKL